jgi:hypothetical protein
LSQSAIAAMAQALRFQSNIQSALMLIECADQEINVGMQLFNRRIFARTARRAVATMDGAFFHTHLYEREGDRNYTPDSVNAKFCQADNATLAG